MDNFTVVIPFYNGQRTIERLLEDLKGIPTIVIDDCSDVPYKSKKSNVKVVRLKEKGYFSGAVNMGAALASSDFLILNQDTHLEGREWLKVLEDNRKQYAVIGERIKGEHPSWPAGYIHGTFMFIRKDAWKLVGDFDQQMYPLWGATAEWQARACRAGFIPLMLKEVPGFKHFRQGRYGSSIQTLLQREPENKPVLTRIPPEVSVIVPCYKQGKYLPDLINSLLGGETSLGYFDVPKFQSFEIIIIDDCSPDDTWEWCKKVHNPLKGIKCYHLDHNVGTAEALNSGIRLSHAPYVTMLCGDDMRRTDSLGEMYQLQLANPHSFIYDGILPFREHEYRPDITIGVSAYDFDRLLYRNHIHMGIMMPRAAWEEVGGYPKIMSDGREDWAINIALGRAGWCGVYHKKKGYLYRREDQNRTMTNTTIKHYQYFLNKLIGLFPDVYKGVYPMACCGRKNKSKRSQPSPKGATMKKAPAALSGSEGMTILEYTGKNFGRETLWGASGQKYHYSAGSRRFLAANEDLRTTNGQGLLDLRENGRPKFRIISTAQLTKEKDIASASIRPAEAEMAATPTPATIDHAVIADGTDFDINNLTAAQIREFAKEWSPAMKSAALEVELGNRQRKSVIALLSDNTL